MIHQQALMAALRSMQPGIGASQPFRPSTSADRAWRIAHSATNQTMEAKLAPPRKSLSHLRASGTYHKNPGRYSGWNEPIEEALGDPSEWLSKAATDAWLDMVPSMPWLRRSHRFIMEIASILTSKMAAGELGVPGMNLLRIVMGKLGATPADFSRIDWTPPATDDEDPAVKYFR